MTSQFPPVPPARPPQPPKEYQDDLQRYKPNKDYIPPAIKKAMENMPPEKAYKSASSNFYTIAGLSFVNSVLAVLGMSFVFVVGLGITQLVDAIMYIIKTNQPSQSLILTFVGLLLDFGVCVAIAVLGYFTSKGENWALIVGMILYALDSILVLYFKIWIGFAFHLFFLWQIWGMYRILGYWKKLDKVSVDSFPQNIG